MRTLKKVLLVLLVILLVVALAAAGWFGYRWYRDNHIFVEDAVYPKSAQSLDLRESDISFDHYDQVHQQLPECYILWMVPFQGSKYASDSQSLTVTELTQEDAQILLNYFPALTALDASGCDDYALLSSLQEQMPQCQITYQVDLGGTVCELDTAQLDLQPGDYTYEALLENLTYLTQVSSVTIHTPEETGEELDALKAEIAGTSEAVVRALGLFGVVRLDYMIEKGVVYLNEINTIPGSLAHYLFPQWSYGEFLTRLIEAGIARGVPQAPQFPSKVLEGVGEGYRKLK